MPPVDNATKDKNVRENPVPVGQGHPTPFDPMALGANQGPAYNPSPAARTTSIFGETDEERAAREQEAETVEQRRHRLSFHHGHLVENYFRGDPKNENHVNVCVVDGQGSHRTDWKHSNGTFVACDHHTPEEFQKAVSELQNKRKGLMDLRGVPHDAIASEVKPKVAEEPKTGVGKQAPAKPPASPVVAPGQPTGAQPQRTPSAESTERSNVPSGVPAGQRPASPAGSQPQPAVTGTQEDKVKGVR